MGFQDSPLLKKKKKNNEASVASNGAQKVGLVDFASVDCSELLYPLFCFKPELL